MFLNPMNEEVYSLPSMIEEQLGILDERIRTQFSRDELLSIRSIVLTGCGDSYMAGRATQFFFNKLCGIPTLALTAMDAARYFLVDSPSEAPNNPLVMATSVSGMVSRTVEAMQVARDRGALTVALTGHPEAPLAQAARHMIDCTLAPMPNAGTTGVPGVRSYRMTLMVQYLFAIHLAEVSGKITLDQGKRLRDQLKKTAGAVQATLEANEPVARELAKTLSKSKYFVFVGDGPHRATADFCAAKIIEAAGCAAYGQDTEEWAHLQYFESAVRDTPTFLISSGHRGHDRMAELISTIKNVGRITVAVAPDGDTLLSPQAQYVMPVMGNVSEFFSPMVSPVGPELFSAFLAEELGVPFFRADQEVYVKAASVRIRESKINSLGDLESSLI